MAKLIFGLTQPLDGYVDSTAGGTMGLSMQRLTIGKTISPSCMIGTT